MSCGLAPLHHDGAKDGGAGGVEMIALESQRGAAMLIEQGGVCALCLHVASLPATYVTLERLEPILLRLVRSRREGKTNDYWLVCKND